MSDELVIITPELERGSGGVADYTLHLVEAWRGRRTLATGGFAMTPDGQTHTPD